MTTSTDRKHLILYDGLCGLCNRLNRFIIKRDRQGLYFFASQQSELGREVLQRHGFNAMQLETFFLITYYGSDSEEVLSRSVAALFISSTIGWPWKAATVLGILPTSWLDFIYNIVASNRYRVFGKFDTCPAPDEKTGERFLEV